MAARKPPTERQRRLGAELRKMREHLGLSLTEAAEMHGTDRTTISNTEAGRFGVSPDRVRVWAANYSCPDRDYVAVLADMARERRSSGPSWWDEYQESLPATAIDLAEMEHHATSLRAAQITHMPGLLQHEEYVRAIFAEAVPPMASDDFERKLRFRLGRAQVLDRADAPTCTFIIHEAALRMRFGGKDVTRVQLRHLLDQSDRGCVSVRVLPFDAGAFPSAGDQAVYAHGPVPQLDTVQKDTPAGSAFLHAETHLANYHAVLDRMEERALDPGPSQDFIRDVTQQL
ncbi:Scr1 family TA system antitoxin-like transcriptional regulator [Streptomyces iconiensis]|uniref:Scr1 family TA system antitoxin-like transcriptional regulator n=1 Tax=Streptomyces iconiensis TaxID=1384038 RepID=A0ABT7AAM0_9ACTN|nr:Scr1 family TA system antitoxin-like transcriptional regulator [Streptomyces iconiensis]MDJ1138375.1 Scr1 family TA system antitoxin-like transcriptional regulator [Streptomyces iconiensis]